MGISIWRERAGKNNGVLQLAKLTEEQKNLWNGFIVYEKQRGIKLIEQKVIHLSRFFLYSNSMALNMFEFTVRSAQEFQTYLTTLEKEDGSPHYATLTVKTIISIVTRFYNYLKSIGKIHTNPFFRIKKIRTERKLPKQLPYEKIMNDILEELSMFWKHKNIRDQRIYYKTHVMAELMYATGMRIGEVLRLTKEDINFESNMIIVKGGKKEKERIAYLNDYALKVLRIYVSEMKDIINVKKSRKTIFGVGTVGTILQTFHKKLDTVCKKHGIKRFTSHNFRHTLGFHLLRRGCDMRYIQLILGHKDMNTTTIYTKVEKGDLRRELDTCHPRQFRRDRNGTA